MYIIINSSFVVNSFAFLKKRNIFKSYGKDKNLKLIINKLFMMIYIYILLYYYISLISLSLSLLLLLTPPPFLPPLSLEVFF